MDAEDALDFILTTIEGLHPRDVRDHLHATEDSVDHDTCVELVRQIERVSRALSSAEVRAAVLAAAETD